jgi:hypothetical protein
MRGNSVSNFSRQLNDLTTLLLVARMHPVTDWREHYKKVRPIRGIALSTYTKFLNFLSVRIHSYPALILDNRIIEVVKRGIFEEFIPLRESIARPSAYPLYLECMHDLAKRLAVPAEKIEFFLFEFGLNLKPPARQGA